ncbi:MAG: DDE-type integrase/transposase/recombinase [Patescibacteria group bacterium]
MQTPKYDHSQRAKWYLQVNKYRKSVKEVCRIFGISRKCYYKWLTRDFGQRGNRYYPAKNQPNLKLTYELKVFIEHHKLISNYGPLKMKLLVKKSLGLDISSTIIYRYYQRKRLIRKPQKKLPWYEPMTQALKVEKPGQGVQMDVKYVYPNGKREFQFSVFDPFTKKHHFTVFPNRTSRNAIEAFKYAQRYFGFKIASVQTDNGGEFRGEFHLWLTANNIPHYFIPKKSPWWNANVERVHKTIDDDYYQNPKRVWQTPYEWLYYYNFKRIHLSLNGLTPQEKLLQSVTLDC